jgi:hypothetical protein
MTDQITPQAGAPVAAVKIVPDIPVIFADGAMSQAFGPGISKFYLYRTDFDPLLAEPNKNTPIVQIVMPAEGFAALVHFLQHRLRMMVEGKAISQEAVDRINQTKYPPPHAG